MKRFWVVGLVLLLCGCGKAKSTEEWVQQLKDKDGAVRLHAIKALSEKKGVPREVVPALAQALKDQNAFVRRDAARALSRLGADAKPATPFLVAALRDKNRAVSKDAAAALKRIDPDAAAKAGVH